MENPIKMDDLGVALFLETRKSVGATPVFQSPGNLHPGNAGCNIFAIKHGGM